MPRSRASISRMCFLPFFSRIPSISWSSLVPSSVASRAGWRMRNRGSSPRVRGWHIAILRSPYSYRFIPARPGKPLLGVRTAARDLVHPRACGAVRRGPPLPEHLDVASPHTRGRSVHILDQFAPPRFIPARAGNRHIVVRSNVVAWVHPRLGGRRTTAVLRPWGGFLNSS